jgi:AcrR family transcriptional regulator
MDSKIARNPEFTRRQIKIAAKREFNSTGYFATDTNKIARLAGYAPGTFYRHFEDKIDIFLEIYKDWTEEQFKEVERALSLGGNIEAMAERLTSIIIWFYGNWRPLRASARVLRISEPRVQTFRAGLRVKLVQRIAHLRHELKLSPLPEEKIITFLILSERLGDAVADGEFDLPTLPKNAGHDALNDFISRFLHGNY